MMAAFISGVLLGAFSWAAASYVARTRAKGVVELTQLFDYGNEAREYMNSIYNLFAECDRMKLVSVRTPYTSSGYKVELKYRPVDGHTRVRCSGRRLEIISRSQGSLADEIV